MKLLKIAFLSVSLLGLTSCAHYGQKKSCCKNKAEKSCCKDKKSCDKKDGKKCDKKKKNTKA